MSIFDGIYCTLLTIAAKVVDCENDDFMSWTCPLQRVEKYNVQIIRYANKVCITQYTIILVCFSQAEKEVKSKCIGVLLK